MMNPVPVKRSWVEYSDEEYDSGQEDRSMGSTYSETLLALKKWLDIEIKETSDFFAPSVFSQTSKFKISAQVTLALPFHLIVKLWDFKELGPLGSQDWIIQINPAGRMLWPEVSF